MTKMYIANCTHQVQDFIYRLPESGSARTQRIDLGSQIAISGDLSTHEIDAIIAQHTPYGLVAVAEIDRTKPFIGVCYQLDRPVPVEKIKRAIIHNTGVLVDRGVEMRKTAAVAVNQALEQHAPGAALQALEMSVVEETSGDDQSRMTPPLAEGVRVEPAPGSPNAPQPNRGRAGRGRRAA